MNVQKLLGTVAALIGFVLTVVLHDRLNFDWITALFAAGVILLAIALPVVSLCAMVRGDASWMSRIGSFLQSWFLLVYVCAIALLDTGKSAGLMQSLLLHFICLSISLVPFGLGALLVHFSPESREDV